MRKKLPNADAWLPMSTLVQSKPHSWQGCCRDIPPDVQRGMRIPENRAQEKTALQKLAQDFCTETAAFTIATLLDALIRGLANPLTAERRALIFLQAGGLPPLIHHLRGTATSTSDPSSRTISNKASEALTAFLTFKGPVWTELCSARSIIPQLMDALHAAPTVMSRGSALSLLLVFVYERTECKPLAEAGLIGRVLELFNYIWTYHPDIFDVLVARGKTWNGVGLVGELVCAEAAAAEDLRRAICGPSTAQAFAALLIAKVHQPPLTHSWYL